jgi:hypothetical protein
MWRTEVSEAWRLGFYSAAVLADSFAVIFVWLTVILKGR